MVIARNRFDLHLPQESIDSSANVSRLSVGVAEIDRFAATLLDPLDLQTSIALSQRDL
jgi:hypothetical protein